MSVNLIDNLRFSVDKAQLTEALIELADVPGAVSNLRLDQTVDPPEIAYDYYDNQGNLMKGTLTHHAGSTVDIFNAIKPFFVEGEGITITKDDSAQRITISASGVESFLELDDTPDAFGDAGQVVMVSDGRDELEFGNLSLTNLNDTPSTIGQPGQVLRANSDRSGVEWGAAATSGSSGGSVTLGDGEKAVFQIPVLAATRLTATAANTPVFHNIASLTGSGLVGKVTQSAVGGIARITVAQDGYINMTWEDEVMIRTSTAGGSGSSGEFVWAITHYNSAGNDLRSWVGDHAVEDPITSSIKFPFSTVTGLTPVNSGDYFTFNFAFSSSVANKNINFELPADNAGLDERIEVFFFPTISRVGPTGPRGPAGPVSQAKIIAFDTAPTVLTPFVNGQILGINKPNEKLVEVVGGNATELHSFGCTFAADSNNPQQSSWVVGTDLNFGYSSFGDVFGELTTADGGKPLAPSDTPVMRCEFEQSVASVPAYTFTTELTFLIRKTDLSSAPTTIFARFYTGPPSDDNQVTTVELTKSADNAMHTYHTYLNQRQLDLGLSESDILSIKRFSLFTSSPPTGDQTSNPLELHEAKKLVDFVTAPATWAKAGQPKPADSNSVVNFEADEADTTKALKVAVEETTPAMSGGSPTASPSDILLLRVFTKDFLKTCLEFSAQL